MNNKLFLCIVKYDIYITNIVTFGLNVISVSAIEDPNIVLPLILSKPSTKFLVSKYMFLGCSKEFKPCYFVNIFNAFKKITLSYFLLHISSYEPLMLFY